MTASDDDELTRQGYQTPRRCAEVLDVARAAGLYRDTGVTDIEDPFPFALGTYDAIAAVGVIGVGAAPASLLRLALEALATDGRMVFSYNDHALTVPEFTGVLTLPQQQQKIFQNSAAPGAPERPVGALLVRPAERGSAGRSPARSSRDTRPPNLLRASGKQLHRYRYRPC
ncbi:MAG: SAM-dependent methyltransferase [Candidatus Azotimanducaceae bacterium]